MKQIIKFAVVTVIFCLIIGLVVWAGWQLLPWFVVPKIVGPHVEELGKVAGWGHEVISAVTWVIVGIVIFLLQMTATTNRRKRWTALGSLILLVAVYFIFRAWASQGHLYEPSGKPAFYWGLTPQGTIYKQSEPGLNLYTHKPLMPASPEYFAIVKSRLNTPLIQVDPATHSWFDVNTGWPLLWYYHKDQGRYEFYERPAIHPAYQEELQPVTVALRKQWEKECDELKAKADAVAQQKEIERKAEQKRLLEIEQARVETERIKALTAHDEEVARAEEKRKQEQAAQVEQSRKDQETAEKLRHEAIINRRIHEAAASINELECLSPIKMLAEICPDVQAKNFIQDKFLDEYAGRRFKYTGLVTRLANERHQAQFETITVGEIHLMIYADLKPEIGEKMRPNREATLAGTITGITIIPGFTNINGINGQVCILRFGNASGNFNEPTPIASKVQTRPSAPPTKNNAPYFEPMTSYSDNTPVQASVGYVVENGVRLVFLPLRLICGYDRSAVSYSAPNSAQIVSVYGPQSTYYHIYSPIPPSRVTYYPAPRPSLQVYGGRPTYVSSQTVYRYQTSWTTQPHR